MSQLRGCFSSFPPTSHAAQLAQSLTPDKAEGAHQDLIYRNKAHRRGHVESERDACRNKRNWSRRWFQLVGHKVVQDQKSVGECPEQYKEELTPLKNSLVNSVARSGGPL